MTTIASTSSRSDTIQDLREPSAPPPVDESPRARLSRLIERHCFSNESRQRSLDHCGFSAIPAPVLFAKDAGEIDSIRVSDLVQGRVGDCYLLAAIAATIVAPRGRETIEHMFKELPPERGIPRFQVTFPNQGSPISLTVSAVFPDGHVARSGARDAATRREEIWPAVLEKAYAIVHGGFDRIKHGGSMSEALRLFSEHEVVAFDAEAVPGMELTRAFLAGSAMTVATEYVSASNDYKLLPNHAYAIRGFYEDEGETFVVLSNPHGPRGVSPLPIPEREWGSVFTNFAATIP